MPYINPGAKKAPAKKIVVKQSTIDKIKKMGMTAALKKAGSSSNAEYLEGIRRMYGARRLAAAKKSTTATPRTSRTAGATSPKAAPKTSKVGSGMSKPPAGKLPYYYTNAEQAYVKAYGKPKSSRRNSSSAKYSGVFAKPGQARGRQTSGKGYFKS